MTPQQAIAAARSAGEDAKRRDPAVGGIVDELVADIVRRLTPTVTHARTRWDALPVVPATCGECEHFEAVGDGLHICARANGFLGALVTKHEVPCSECPLRKGAM